MSDHLRRFFHKNIIFKPVLVNAKFVAKVFLRLQRIIISSEAPKFQLKITIKHLNIPNILTVRFSSFSKSFSWSVLNTSEREAIRQSHWRWFEVYNSRQT